MQDILQRAARTRLVIFDVDGVLTDGSLYLDDNGMEYKAFNSRDGHGMKLLRQTGVEIAIISGRSSGVVKERMESLGIHHVYQGREDKLNALGELLDRLDTPLEEVAYVGDDVIDLPVMRRVGLAVAVADAHPFVCKHAHWQTPSPGGRGAAREVCELIMEAQGTLQAILEAYL
ncbi:3-deoxy-manno-octulosonate-8-phosphatase KdsC [Thioalbus denitrificans]|uniref:3-deoxy-D-manno-octulosonate 8-phosphate phosphatase KdsC n=1 Tax=Thioalbus denitrificans TaxID=547122 RepID=A0A369CC06_9GAMM|nr:3-deoxy-manno-octulosonate-8-phosphatase KdsC [Thioalbus denitrificans]RCX31081.1 3-deoxy-D-manno-octulosonate 8-phosphate phosphatase (KDO 8-P phosphatase) [Thioalbus denitrificans]